MISHTIITPSLLPLRTYCTKVDESDDVVLEEEDCVTAAVVDDVVWLNVIHRMGDVCPCSNKGLLFCHSRDDFSSLVFDKSVLLVPLLVEEDAVKMSWALISYIRTLPSIYPVAIV